MGKNWEPLTEANVSNFINKKIVFTAEGYEMNRNYRGVAIIKSMDFSKSKPLECDCLEGDDLSYAFLDDHGLYTEDNGESYRAFKTETERCLSYTDGYREIFIKEL